MDGIYIYHHRCGSERGRAEEIGRIFLLLSTSTHCRTQVYYVLNFIQKNNTMLFQSEMTSSSGARVIVIVCLMRYIL